MSDDVEDLDVSCAYWKQRSECMETTKKAAEARVAELTARVGTLFDAVAHGDEEHMAWLKTAIADHFAGRPVERPSGKGTKEALTARVGELEAALERLRSGIQQAMGALETCTKTTTDVVWYDDITTMWEHLALILDDEALSGLSDEAKSGSPAPVRDIQEERMDAYQFGTVPAPVGEDIAAKAQKLIARLADGKTTGAVAVAAMFDEMNGLISEIARLRPLAALGEAERAVVEAAMDAADKLAPDNCYEVLWEACDDLAKAREAGGEQAKREAEV